MGKSKQKIYNWKQYNQALVKRGFLTLWMDEQAIKQGYCQTHHGRRGRGFHYSDSAIETALMLKRVFKLPLRALEGFINSLFMLMDVPLQSPDYNSINKRAKQINIQYRLPSQGPVAHLVIDATGLKVYGEGEWKVRKHGKEKRRDWRKLHLAVDAQSHAIVAAEVSFETVGDNEALPTLLNQIQCKIEQVSADGAYDTKECHALLKKKGAKMTIPPRKNAALWEEGHPRNEAVKALEAGELEEWKYHQRSKAETSMYRFKQPISSTLSLRSYNAQVGEALARMMAMNKMTGLGMPARQQVN